MVSAMQSVCTRAVVPERISVQSVKMFVIIIFVCQRAQRINTMSTESVHRVTKPASVVQDHEILLDRTDVCLARRQSLVMSLSIDA